MLELEAVAEKRNSLLAELGEKLKMDLKVANRTNSSKMTEGFFKEVFDFLYPHWHLENLNRNKSNAAAIDLASNSRAGGEKIAVQVTSTVTPDKIRKTLKTFTKYNLERKFDRLIFAYPTMDPPKGTRTDFSRYLPEGFQFDVRESAYNFQKLLEDVSDRSLEQQRKFQDLLTQHITRVRNPREVNKKLLRDIAYTKVYPRRGKWAKIDPDDDRYFRDNIPRSLRERIGEITLSDIPGARPIAYKQREKVLEEVSRVIDDLIDF